MWVENRAGTALQPCLSWTSTTFFIPHHLWMAFLFGRKCLLCDHYLRSVMVRRSCQPPVQRAWRHVTWAPQSDTPAEPSTRKRATETAGRRTWEQGPRWLPRGGVLGSWCRSQLGLLAMRARHADCLVCGTQQRHWAQFPHSSSSTSGFGGLLLEA